MPIHVGPAFRRLGNPTDTIYRNLGVRTRAELARRRAFLDLQLSPPQDVQVVAADLIGLRDQRA